MHAEDHQVCPPQCWVYRQTVTGPDKHTHQYPEVHERGQESNIWDSSFRGMWVGPSPPPAKRNEWKYFTTKLNIQGKNLKDEISVPVLA